MDISLSFLIRALSQKQPRCPVTEDWIHRVGYSTAMKINKLILKNVMSREKKKKLERNECMLCDSSYAKFKNRQNGTMIFRMHT